MKRSNPSQTLALAVLTAVIGGFVGASATTAYMMPAGAMRHSIRSDIGTINRSAGYELLEQDRRTARLRALQEEVYMSAPEDDVQMELDARAHGRAYRWCMFNSYSHPRRLTSCVDSMLQNGSYDPID